MGTIGWLLLVAIGMALGFSAGRLWPGSSGRLTEMERQRDLAREDLKNYRAEVSQHFERTAELFDKVTSDYRNLYEHLALSARQLGAIPGESTETRLAEPEQRRLGVTPAEAAAGAEALEDTPVRPPRDYEEVPGTEAEEESDPEDELAIRRSSPDRAAGPSPSPERATTASAEELVVETEPDVTQPGTPEPGRRN